jgi:hypothetical protein
MYKACLVTVLGACLAFPLVCLRGAQSTAGEQKAVDIALDNVKYVSEPQSVGCAGTWYINDFEIDSVERRPPAEGRVFVVVTLRMTTSSKRPVTVNASDLVLFDDSGSRISGRFSAPLLLAEEDRARLRLPKHAAVFSGLAVPVSRSRVGVEVGTAPCNWRGEKRLVAVRPHAVDIPEGEDRHRVEMLFEVPKARTAGLRIMFLDKVVGSIPAETPAFQLTLRTTMDGRELWAPAGGKRRWQANLPCEFVFRLQRGAESVRDPEVRVADTNLARAVVGQDGTITLNLLQPGATKITIASSEFNRELDVQTVEGEKNFECQVLIPQK